MIKLLIFLLFPYLLVECSVFDTYKGEYYDTSVYDTKKSDLNEQASQNKQIKCRVICDKKLYKEQKISDAIEFYKKSKDYNFNKN